MALLPSYFHGCEEGFEARARIQEFGSDPPPGCPGGGPAAADLFRFRDAESRFRTQVGGTDGRYIRVIFREVSAVRTATEMRKSPRTRVCFPVEYQSMAETGSWHFASR